jgi:hypothetical protein
MLISHTKHDIQWQQSINYPVLISPVYISGLVWRMRGGETSLIIAVWTSGPSVTDKGGGVGGAVVVVVGGGGGGGGGWGGAAAAAATCADERPSPLELAVYILPVFRLSLVQWAGYKLDGTSLIPARPESRLCFPLSFLLTGHRWDSFSGERGVKLTPHLKPLPVTRIRCAAFVLPHTPSWRIA